MTDREHTSKQFEQQLRTLKDKLLLMGHHAEKMIASIFIARHLERVGDHSSNIAEMVIFMVRGQDIRHGIHRAGA